MMLPTHAVWGMALALPLVFAAPDVAGVALFAGFLGGVVPDLDLYVGHRRTLHYPVYYSALAGAGAVGALVAPTSVTVAVAFFFVGAAVHSVSDVLGGGLELRPWEGTSDRAVYDHYRGEWLVPRRWVRYDGAPEDLLLAVAGAAPLLLVLDGVLRGVVGVTLAVAVAYASVRRVLPTVAERLVGVLPDRVLPHLPARYRSGDHATTDGR